MLHNAVKSYIIIHIYLCDIVQSKGSYGPLSTTMGREIDVAETDQYVKEPRTSTDKSHKPLEITSPTKMICDHDNN